MQRHGGGGGLPATILKKIKKYLLIIYIPCITIKTYPSVRYPQQNTPIHFITKQPTVLTVLRSESFHGGDGWEVCRQVWGDGAKIGWDNRIPPE